MKITAIPSYNLNPPKVAKTNKMLAPAFKSNIPMLEPQQDTFSKKNDVEEKEAKKFTKTPDNSNLNGAAKIIKGIRDFFVNLIKPKKK